MKKLNLTKKILLILVLVVSAVFINSYALIINLTSYAAKTEYAANNYGSTSIQIKNGKFTSHQTAGNGLPDKVDDWTVAENVNEVKTLKGIISVDNEAFKKYGGLSSISNPHKPEGIEDDYILVMHSIGNQQTKYGYKSSAIKLESDKFYAISLHCKTIDNASASIYVSSKSNYLENSFENISTNGRWEQYYFLIATDSFSSTDDFQVELRLGSSLTTESKGTVFFDQVEITEVANRDFYTADEVNFNIRKINLDNDYIENFLVNPSFENDLTGYVVENDNSVAKANAEVMIADAINQKLVDNFSLSPRENYANNNIGEERTNKELLIMNVDKASTIVKTAENNKIQIQQHGFYRLSMFIKTSEFTSGGLDIKLTNTTQIINKDEEVISKSQTGLKSSTGGAYNGFTRVDFYIRGNAWRNCEIALSIALGTEESKLTGWAIIDNIILQRINSEEYAKGTESNQLDLSKNVKNTSDITNGLFNFVKSNSSQISYPALPQDWTASSNMENLEAKSGIIRVNQTHFDADSLNYGLYSNKNPGPNDANTSTPLPSNTLENVLMIRNTSDEDIYFKSTPTSNISLSPNSTSSATIVKIDVSVKTLGDSKAFIQVASGNDIIASLDEISSPNWTTYTIYIKNGMSSKNINLILGTHGNGKNNYSFFDDVVYKSGDDTFNLDSYLKPQTQEEIKKYKNSIYVDLLENGFYSHSNQIVSGNIYKQNAMVIHKNEQAIQYNGIINTAGNDSLKVHKDAKGTNVLVIRNETKSCQVLKTIDTYDLIKDSYYEFSVWIKTSNLSGLNENFGAYFELVNVDEDGNIIEDSTNKNKFTRIIETGNDEENNGWVKYSMYVLAESNQNVKVLLGLGYEDNATQGDVYFDDLRIVEIDQNEYVSQKADRTTLVSKVIETPQEETDNDNSSSEENNNQDNNLNIWALLSSIILVIALILAIAGYSFRKIPKRKIAKIKASDYEKSPFAVDEDEIRRELKLKREENIVELNKQIEELEASKVEMTNKHEEEIAKIDNDKEKNNLYIKHTKEINKIDKKINYLQSALTHISDLVNIKNSEQHEINERKKQAKEEFIKLKQAELEKEQEQLNAQENQDDSPKKNKKRKYKKTSSKKDSNK